MPGRGLLVLLYSALNGGASALRICLDIPKQFIEVNDEPITANIMQTFWHPSV
jgi:hypothetical protein